MDRQRVSTERLRHLATPAASSAARPLELRLGNLEWSAPNSPERVARRRRHRRLRRARRIISSVFAFCLVGGIVFTALLLITPPVANAPQLISTMERADNAAMGRLVFPARFSDALTGLQNRRHPRSNAMSGVAAVPMHLLGPSRRSELALGDQLASMLYLAGRHGAVSQIERAMLALKLNWTYSRRALVSMYAAVADFGHGYYGLVAASAGYFGRRPAQLSWAQMAALVALTASPSADDPYAHLARTRADQATVLEGMVAAGVLGRAQANQALREPLHLVRRQTARADRRS